MNNKEHLKNNHINKANKFKLKAQMITFNKKKNIKMKMIQSKDLKILKIWKVNLIKLYNKYPIYNIFCKKKIN